MIIEEHAKYKRMENKAYYEKNKSFILENKKQYYELHKEEILRKKKLRYKIKKMEQRLI